MNECVEGFFYVWSVCWIIERRKGWMNWRGKEGIRSESMDGSLH